MADINVGILYLSLHNLLRKKVGVNREISKKDFYCMVGKHFLVPKNIRAVIIKEMEIRGLVKQQNKDTITVLSCDIDLEKNPNKFFQNMGIY